MGILKKKIIYITLTLVILAAILGPSIYANKFSRNQIAAQFKNNTTTQTGESKSLPASDASKAGEQKTEAKQEAELKTGDAMPFQESEATDKDIKTKPVDKNNNSGLSENKDSAGQLNKNAAAPDSSQEISRTVGMAVVGKEGELLYAPGSVTVTSKNIWDTTALGALDATSLPYKVSSGFSGFVEEIAGCRNKGQSGWMYMVNGEVPGVSASQKQVKTGDKVIWWYSKSMDAPMPDWDALLKK
ncbi:hypothetical protein Dtox_0560 [Desulfofarcimen acetoxidans DSM 771]|uniref:Transcobalamin-like C-terminal domain-containing protein n=1 Tax=Desulfofarcimen acetoxidans (strain ATCC 49208 / DSM 771 / KCTC 5769 / VKM B-1644 / 5575) TaxID=485916 RepID=C8W625_DESAS|nr:DUF4430 domain-containing protein [Desulfofarcimen acetoxidans]ACV61480.1 hypothetical protein Dtox_0560 [Desulfofarcimen acetoxidans DSM 771]